MQHNLRFSEKEKLMSPILFFFPYKQVTLRQRSQLKSFISWVFKNKNKKFNTLHFIFCSDQELLIINQQFLQHDYFTDIITFNLSETEEIEGEIYISVERVKENALKLQRSIKEELHRVIFHGILHLCGYKDKTKAQEQEMRKQEDFLLQKYFSTK